MRLTKFMFLLLTLVLCVSFMAGCGLGGNNSSSNSSKSSGNGSFDYSSIITKPKLKLEDSIRCEDCCIEMDSKHNPSASYYITPSGFDWDELDMQGYYMTITVTYDVYYQKDWSFDLTYAGSPKYELYILNSENRGVIEEDLTTTTTSTTKTATFRAKAVNLKNEKIRLTFSTDNIQNEIYFKNIRVDYKCSK